MIPEISERVLILAPRGRDATVAAAMVREAGFRPAICASVPELVAEITVGAGIAVVTDDALRTSDLRPLVEWLGEQPPWSDFPFVLLTERGGGLERNPTATRYLELLGNVTFVERPFHPTTLVSLARSAIRGRRRQYEARSRLDALQENERQLRTLANSIPTLCWMAEADGHIFWYNQQWYDYTGATPAEMEGWGWQSVQDPDTLPAVLERWGASLATGEAFEMVFPLRASDGSFRPFLTRVQPFRDADGQVSRWFGTNTDISVQQRAEQAVRNYAADLENRVADRTAELAASERRLRSLFETSFMFQCLIDRNGILTDANATSLKAIASEKDAVVGKPIWETPWVAGTPGLVEPVRERFARIVAGETLRRELAVNLPTGPRIFDLSLRPMHGEKDDVVAVVMEALDITERRQAEEALRQSQKLEAMGQLTGGVAHDFNNLLMPIIGALDLIQRRYAGKSLDERAATLLEGAMQSAERARILVQRLLGFARRQALDTRAVDIEGLIEGMRDLVRSSIGADVRLHLNCASNLPPALADANQLELAVLNLCVNARDAMPDGGDLAVGADLQDVEVGDESAVKPGRYVRLFVSDTGKGMDAETLARAIEPFFSTKPLGQGTGLGLSMVHGLVAQLGGGFTLFSTPGKGSTVSLYLPIAGSAAQMDDIATPSPVMIGDRSLSILLVDDEDLVRTGAAEMLRDLGHVVTEASGGAEALARVGEGLAFDLLVTDYKMPQMNGAELAKSIRALRPGTAILLISGYTGVDDEAPELPRLAKPFRQSDLAQALARFRA